MGHDSLANFGGDMKEKWFEAGKKTGWSKLDSAEKRRRTVLKSRHGDELKAGRACLALSNVTRDKVTHDKARADADYFFRQHRKKKR
jgi:hypothetical protein